jgi:hypothetical protein
MKKLLALIPIAFLAACAPFGADEERSQVRIGSVKLGNALLEYVSFQILPEGTGAAVSGNVTPPVSNSFLYPAEGHLDLLVFNGSNKLIEKSAVRIASVISPLTFARQTRLWEWRFATALKTSSSQIAPVRFVYDESALD